MFKQIVLLFILLQFCTIICSSGFSSYAVDIKSENTTVSQSVYNQKDDGNSDGDTNNEKPKEENAQARKEPETEIRISFAGDCTLGTDETFQYLNSFPYRLQLVKNNFSYFFKGVQPIFGTDDLTLVNLETTFTNSKNKAVKEYRFKGAPSYVNILKAGSVEMVNISNNHIYDYLTQGYNDTLKALKEAGVLFSGEGNVAYFEVKGIKIASLGYTGWDISKLKSICNDIKKVRETADIVIVSFHWGLERSFYPNEIQLQLGRACIDSGADIVVGHHPHVIQGIENYKGKYIVYSLGNFCFGGNLNPDDKDSFIFQNIFTIKDKKLIKSTGDIIPCSISSVDYVNDYQPTILESASKERVLSRIYEYSKALKYGIMELK